MNALLILQARTGSKRFPNKVLKKVLGIPVIVLIVKRLFFTKKIDKIIVATSNNKRDDKLVNIIKRYVEVFRGSEKNVLKRFYCAAKKFNPKFIIRITADCPFVNSRLIDKMILIAMKKKFDYISNVNPHSFPKGLDIEIFKFSLLKKIYKTSKNPNILEHVTYSIRKSKKIKKYNLRHKKDYSKFDLCLDYKEDLEKIRKIYSKYGIFNFSLKKLFYILKNNLC
ncbi:hypothetical protein OA094_02245 [Candidatus Pelagibacter sp.]|nr:hypothetical protein [Candidatus Pelagibacter sp.]|tara:strand:- start:4461 stop:5135 length:675 start_codon:yes stop_codon:yes gene_type:complete